MIKKYTHGCADFDVLLNEVGFHLEKKCFAIFAVLRLRDYKLLSQFLLSVCLSVSH